MSSPQSSPRMPILPAHLEQTVTSIAKLHAEHAKSATPLERLIGNATATLARPSAILLLTAAAASWIGVNVILQASGHRPIDAPPFCWLQGVASLLALYVTILILIVQRRDDRLACHREQLTLEVSIVAEQKISKVIELLEEFRRDDPTVRDRIDPDAIAMARTADPEAVLEAINQTHDEMIDEHRPVRKHREPE